MCATRKDKNETARDRAMRIASKNLAAMSDDEDARLTAAAIADTDNPPLGQSFFKNARRGRPALPKGEKKKSITIRLDPDVVAHFKAGGKGWQSEMNAVLKKAIGGA